MYNVLNSPGGGIGIRGRLRACALTGVEVRVLSRALLRKNKNMKRVISSVIDEMAFLITLFRFSHMTVPRVLLRNMPIQRTLHHSDHFNRQCLGMIHVRGR